MPAFETKLLQMGNNTGIEVPGEVIEALGGGKKPAVVVTIGTFTYRSTVGVMGGRFLIPLSAERRAQSGLKGGDLLVVQLERDAAPRDIDVPDDLQVALAQEPEASAFFDTLAPSYKQRHVLSLSDAKTTQTRQRRLAKIMEMLREGRK